MKHSKLFRFILVTGLLFAPSLQSSPQKPKLTDFARNDFSQWGEDGIIEKIFQIIGTTSKVAIEFGAHNGLYLSNTARLWKTQGWKAVLIEGNKQYFDTLLKNTRSFDCLPICKYVGIEENNNLETILKQHGIDEQIDLLSIDIDGNDYYVFQSLKTRPRVIIVEHNPTLPATLDLYQLYDPKSSCRSFGCSVAALNRIAESKGYKLIAITKTNSFFVLEKLFDKFEMFETSLREMQVDTCLKYIVTTYSGKYLGVATEKRDAYGMKGPAMSNTLQGSAHLFSVPIK